MNLKDIHEVYAHGFIAPLPPLPPVLRLESHAPSPRTRTRGRLIAPVRAAARKTARDSVRNAPTAH